MALLKAKTKENTRTLSVRLPADLVGEIDRLKAEAADAGLVFDVPDVVARALTGAIRQGRIELASRAPLEASPALRAEGAGLQALGSDAR